VSAEHDKGALVPAEREPIDVRKDSRGWLPSPALLVSMVALVLALGGTAIALPGKGTVKTNDIARAAVTGKKIAKAAVKTGKIKNNQVTPLKLDLVKVDGLTGPLPTASAPPIDLGGPSVTVKVPFTGLVAVYARATGQVQGGGQNSRAQVHLVAPGVIAGAPRILEFATADPQLRVTSPGVGDASGDGTPALTRGGFLVFPADRGTYTFSLLYSQAGGGTANFTNTGLWAGVIG
jgi:hypothetical protein